MASEGDAINREEQRALQLQVLRPLHPRHFFLGHAPQEFGKEERERQRLREETGEITLGEISKYFDLPISAAAVKLKIGETRLKKKCREQGIPRWPRRKMKSLEALISNVDELGKGEWDVEEGKLRQTIGILERDRRAMQVMPGEDLDEATKKLRQACFKAKYNRRKMQREEASSSRK